MAPDWISCLQLVNEIDTPDVILLDLHLRGMSGIELLDEMRLVPEYSSVPVILITGGLLCHEALPSPDKYEAIVEKPFDLEELLSVVDEQVSFHTNSL